VTNKHLKTHTFVIAMTATVEYMIGHIADFRHELFMMLGASYTSLITSMVGFELSTEQKKLYLHPMRDLARYETWVNKKITDGFYVTLVGKDLYFLMARITNPLVYAKLYGFDKKIVVWMAVVDTNEFQYTPEDVGMNMNTGLRSDYDWSKYPYDPAYVPGYVGGDSTVFISLLDKPNRHIGSVWYDNSDNDTNSVKVMEFHGKSGHDSDMFAHTRVMPRDAPSNDECVDLILERDVYEDSHPNNDYYPAMIMTAYINLHLDPFNAIKVTPIARSCTDSYWYRDTITLANMHGRLHFDTPMSQPVPALHIPMTDKGLYTTKSGFHPDKYCQYDHVM
jgi:hypothetical protein